MMPQGETDYKLLFSQLIKKQMLVLGPDITLAKVRNVTGLTVDINGDVQKIDGDPQLLLQALINQFVELSGMIVKKTMESILNTYPGMMAMATSAAFGPAAATTNQTQTQTQPTVQTSTEPKKEPVVVDTTTNTDTPSSIVEHHDEQPPHTDLSVSTSSVEPPPMTSMNIQSLSIAPKEEKKPEPVSFSTTEMEDLNKALEQLSNAPLSSEQVKVGKQFGQ